MSDFIAYHLSDGCYYYRVYPTGKCKKKVITYQNGEYSTYEYVQVRIRFLGIPLWTKWISKDYIKWRRETEEIYECGADCR